MPQDDLFPDPAPPPPDEPPANAPPAPLAVRMRPRSLDEILGQHHLLAPGKLLRRAIEADRVQSLILFGPPGTGKTTLAQIIALRSQCRFERLSGVESTVADIRRVLATAAHRLARQGHPTQLFIDELHRFNKAQQDVLLPDVENGVVRLIGATTENPFFFVNAPLVSRSQVFELQPLSEEDLIELLRRALALPDRGLGHLPLHAEEPAWRHLARRRTATRARPQLPRDRRPNHTSRADGRRKIDLTVAEQCIQKKAVVYDTDGDAHYDTISAFIKSMRGSDPDATLYWLAKMIHAGEDPRFIARRIVIHAAEDVGLADPIALLLATPPSSRRVHRLARSPNPHRRSRPLHRHRSQEQQHRLAIDAALADVRKGPTLPVPATCAIPITRGAERLGHGRGYQYPHDFPGHIVAQDYLGATKNFYNPSDQGLERQIRDRIEQWRHSAAPSPPDP
jgi:putative ATPase